MPPPDTSSAATIRYLTRLLAAVCMTQPEDTLRIKQGFIDRVKGESSDPSSRLLFEDYDDNTKEVVLRFRPSSLATYSIAEVQSSQPAAPDLTPSPQPTTSSPTSSSAVQQPGRSMTNPLHPTPLALSDEQLARAEIAARQERFRRAVVAKQSRSGSPLDGIL
jgi:hypothetical protein